ncbi:unnamed protein product [Symbiodinium sp. CCMP2592]|nr:unnamed protein product [Symbiodinium sp. CCMP2592]
MAPIVWMLSVVVGVVASQETCEEMSHLQVTGHSMEASSELFWQGYGGVGWIWMWVLGLLGRDTVHWGGFEGTAKVGLALMSNEHQGDKFETVASAAGIIGLLPGCFKDQGLCDGYEHDDLLTALSNSGPMKRAFTMCLDETPAGGGKLFLGMPQTIPANATAMQMVDVYNKYNYAYAIYAPNLTDETVTFSFGSEVVGTQSYHTWFSNEGLYSYVDSGTRGLQLPLDIFGKVTHHVYDRIKHHDKECEKHWGDGLLDQLKKLGAEGTGVLLEVNEAQKSCAMDHVQDLVIRVNGNDVVVFKSSFFYETEPCSQRYQISWCGVEGTAVILGTAFFWGKNLLFDTSTIKVGGVPYLYDLGPADGCQKDYGQIPGNEISLSGPPGQVLGINGTITAVVKVGTPPQELTVQLDTGSAKFFAVHKECRKLMNCFMVNPPSGTSITISQKSWQKGNTCQKQASAFVDAMLIQSAVSCSKTGGENLLTCDCPDKQPCYVAMVEAIQKSLIPAEVCGISRKACGEPVDFLPSLSSSFQPQSMSYKFAKAPQDQHVTANCQHNCQYN